MTREFFLCSILCLLATTWSAAQPTLDHAHTLFNQGRYEDALKLVEEVVRTDSSNARAFYELGLISAALQQPSAAITAFQRAIRRKPSSPLAAKAYRELGILHLTKGEPCEAAHAFREALSQGKRQRDQLGEPDFISTVSAILQQLEPTLAQCPAPTTTYALTVQVQPVDSQIRFHNMQAKYYDGIQLKPGQYEIVVEKKGYQPVRRQIAIEDHDIDLRIVLEPVARHHALTVEAIPEDSTIQIVNVPLSYTPEVVEEFAHLRRPSVSHGRLP